MATRTYKTNPSEVEKRAFSDQNERNRRGIDRPAGWMRDKEANRLRAAIASLQPAPKRLAYGSER